MAIIGVMWSVRMRATGRDGAHLAGAEGLYEEQELEAALRSYARRALTHPKGDPVSLVVTAERLTLRPRRIPSLPLMTLACSSPASARRTARRILKELGVSDKALNEAFRTLGARSALRGAVLVGACTGRRLEPDPTRGVRATRMGIGKAVRRALGRRLSRLGINRPQVREALVLASKVAAGPGVLAEVCISDDPDYTTGYVAARGTGYVRLPNIKRAGSRKGGRAIFVEEGTAVDRLIDYLERTPVLVSMLGPMRGATGGRDAVG